MDVRHDESPLRTKCRCAESPKGEDPAYAGLAGGPTVGNREVAALRQIQCFETVRLGSVRLPVAGIHPDQHGSLVRVEAMCVEPNEVPLVNRRQRHLDFGLVRFCDNDAVINKIDDLAGNDLRGPVAPYLACTHDSDRVADEDSVLQVVNVSPPSMAAVGAVVRTWRRRSAQPRRGKYIQADRSGILRTPGDAYLPKHGRHPPRPDAEDKASERVRPADALAEPHRRLRDAPIGSLVPHPASRSGAAEHSGPAWACRPLSASEGRGRLPCPDRATDSFRFQKGHLTHFGMGI